MALLEIAGELIKVLVPPKTNDLDSQQRWRWVVFAAIIGLATSLTLHILLACGYLPALSAGFALASETQSIQKRVDVIATISLEREMRAKAIELCHEKEQQRRNELNDDLSRLQREYRDVTGQWYQVPRCDQL